MSEHYPRIRIEAGYRRVLAREGLSLCFYMHHHHGRLVQPLQQSLNAYLRAVGPQALELYADMEGYWQPLDAAGWDIVHEKLHRPHGSIIQLRDNSRRGDSYAFEYFGKAVGEQSPFLQRHPGAVCAARFWLSTEFLEEHGPERVREVALEVAAPLPFCSGHVGLSFIGDLDIAGIMPEVVPHALRYPGLDILELEHIGWELGTRVRGPHWLNFLGEPVLGALGGVEGLRARLHSPETTVQALEGSRAIVTLGPWPEAGDLQQGQVLPAYRELARVLEPWTFRDERGLPDFTPEEYRRWERRFLD